MTMPQQQQTYQQVQQKFKHHIMKLAFHRLKIYTAIKHQRQSFLVERNIGKQTEFILASKQVMGVLGPLFKERKRVIFRQIENNKIDQQYWKLKSCLMIAGVIDLRGNKLKKWVFTILVHFDQKIDQQLSKMSIKYVSTALKLPIIHILRNSFKAIQIFSNIHQSGNRARQKSSLHSQRQVPTISICRAIELIFKKQLSKGFAIIYGSAARKISHSAVRSANSQPDPSEYEQRQQDEKQIQICEIKSILLTLNRQGKKSAKKIGQQKSLNSVQYSSAARQRSLLRIMQILSQKCRIVISNSFGLLRWRLLSIYDTEMIEKLQAQIDVLSHEFESL